MIFRKQTQIHGNLALSKYGQCPGRLDFFQGKAGRNLFDAGQLLRRGGGPIIGASDYVRAVPESISAYLPNGRDFLTLGTDGFGRSDTRAALRAFFGVDAASIIKAAESLLA